MNCRFAIPVNEAEDPLLCDNPALPDYGHNVKHAASYRCGHGIATTPPEVLAQAIPLEVPPRHLTVMEKLMAAEARRKKAAGADFESLRIANAKDVGIRALQGLKSEVEELAKQALEDGHAGLNGGGHGK
jgi:hypothetical protein